MLSDICELHTVEFPRRAAGKSVVLRNFYLLPYLPEKDYGGVSVWDKDSNKFVIIRDEFQGSDEYFHVNGVYFEPPTESENYGTIYVYLHLMDKLNAGRLWKIQWENVLEQQTDRSSLWNNWSCQPGDKNAGGKTERLNEYVRAIANGTPNIEQTVLCATLYFYVEE